MSSGTSTTKSWYCVYWRIIGARQALCKYINLCENRANISMLLHRGKRRESVMSIEIIRSRRPFASAVAHIAKVWEASAHDSACDGGENISRIKILMRVNHKRSQRLPCLIHDVWRGAGDVCSAVLWLLHEKFFIVLKIHFLRKNHCVSRKLLCFYAISYRQSLNGSIEERPCQTVA